MSVHRPELTGDLPSDVARYLVSYDCDATLAHSRDVALTAARFALRYGLSRESAQTAGWLHDISAVIPDRDRREVAQRWELPVLPEEAAFPMILHQKLSAWMAEHLFAVEDPAVLWAIRSHTTLRAAATPLDQVVFVADKVAWDQPGTPPYLAELENALARSLRAGACAYLSHLWQQRSKLRVVHPWLVDAYSELCAGLQKPGSGDGR